MLYLVPTPVGNLEDISLRALRLLKEVDLILAEDTRTTRKLLAHYDIHTPLKAYHAHNEHRLTETLVSQMAAGSTFALVSDAGTPGISDPGFLLVRACVAAGVPVSALPGPTAFVPALVASGLPCDRFFFEGFLPHKKGRQTRLQWLAELPHTFVLYESPHRLQKCLAQLAEHCGPERAACVARELSKVHEEYVRGTLAELIDWFEAHPPRGEIVIVVGGKP
ncbi:MAG: 16S rRNA (cytidine(1402)-2'-O)-methyltransferase [Bacteroidetes bacterium]|nr:MAG: 16S rRNA (cytidine(1402)-2'-O)-methyltransferase [Bacteroidota bacterium]